MIDHRHDDACAECQGIAQLHRSIGARDQAIRSALRQVYEARVMLDKGTLDARPLRGQIVNLLDDAEGLIKRALNMYEGHRVEEAGVGR